MSYETSSHQFGNFIQQQQVQTFPCPQCQQQFPSQSELDHHCYLHHNGVIKCPHCYQKFKYLECYRKHLLIHTRANLHWCSFCAKSFAQKDDLDNHLLKHTGTKLFRCTECGRAFEKLISLKLHQRSHKRASLHQNTVVDSGLSVAQRNNYDGHITTVPNLSINMIDSIKLSNQSHFDYTFSEHQMALSAALQTSEMNDQAMITQEHKIHEMSDSTTLNYNWIHGPIQDATDQQGNPKNNIDFDQESHLTVQRELSVELLDSSKMNASSYNPTDCVVDEIDYKMSPNGLTNQETSNNSFISRQDIDGTNRDDQCLTESFDELEAALLEELDSLFDANDDQVEPQTMTSDYRDQCEANMFPCQNWNSTWTYSHQFDNST